MTPLCGAMSGPMQRILVLGTSGSGKTTLARRLAASLNAPHVELDALYHGPDWTPAEPGRFREDVIAATAGERWVVDGNYPVVRDVVLERADAVVWLDYPLWRVLARLVCRTLKRGLTRTELWNGNRESLWTNLFTRDSLLLWAVQTHRSRRTEFERLLATLTDTTVHRVREDRELERLLSEAAAPVSRP